MTESDYSMDKCSEQDEEQKGGVSDK